MIQIKNTLRDQMHNIKKNRLENNESSISFVCQRRPHGGKRDKNMRLNII